MLQTHFLRKILIEIFIRHIKLVLFNIFNENKKVFTKKKFCLKKKLFFARETPTQEPFSTEFLLSSTYRKNSPNYYGKSSETATLSFFTVLFV